MIGPHPRDGHHGHETVARAIRRLVWTSRRPLTWWMWPLWADLPRPTLMVPCGEEHLRTSARMLDQHAGENDRNDYRALQTSMRVTNAVRGVETVFGFGSARGDAASVTSAELLTEVTAHRHRWFVGRPRTLDQPRGVGAARRPVDPGQLHPAADPLPPVVARRPSATPGW